MVTYVLAKDGTPLMPTYNIKKVRRLLKTERAVIAGHKPHFTIQLTYDLPNQDAPHTQPVEICVDTGDHHIGFSVKSEKHEFAHEQYDLLPDEKQKHDDCRKYRRARRNRKRYRKPRFNNRRKPEGWMAPSIQNKIDRHVDLIEAYSKAVPVTSVTLETARFDTQLLEAQQAGKPLPEGKDYQQGERYCLTNLREAVFTRDGYTCQCCGKSVKDGVILRVHHALYWKGDHTDRLSGLMTVCDKCHTPANHKPGGKLYGLTPKVKSMAGAAFMNTVRWKIVQEVKDRLPQLDIHVTNGAKTKCERQCLHMEKTHANDAYCMGQFRPKHKAKETVYQKCRRNNRVLSKFYDAKYIDIRDGKKKSGQQLSCNRISRSVPRNNPDNQRIYRGHKESEGRVSVRRQRYPMQKGGIIRYHGRLEPISGMHNEGKYVVLQRKTAQKKQISINVKKVIFVRYAGSWINQT